MKDLYDTLFAPSRHDYDKWETEPDFDEISVYEDDELEDDESELSLDEWLDSASE